MTPPREEPIGLALSRTAKAVTRAFDAELGASGGSLAAWLVLSSLEGGLHHSQRDIAAEIGVEGPTLTHHLNRMEAAGLVTRVRDPRNRRVHQVELTPLGEQDFHALLEVVRDFDQRLRGGFTERELATLRRLLQRLVDNATHDRGTKEAR